MHKLLLPFFALVLSLQLPAQDLKWAKHLGGVTTADKGNSVAIDAAGKMYTTGAFEIGADFDPGPAVSHLSAVVNFDVFVLKMNPAGDFVWARNIGDSAADRGESIQLDDAGNIFVAGVYFITLNNGVKARTGRFVKG